MSSIESVFYFRPFNRLLQKKSADFQLYDCWCVYFCLWMNQMYSSENLFFCLFCNFNTIYNKPIDKCKCSQLNRIGTKKKMKKNNNNNGWIVLKEKNGKKDIDTHKQRRLIQNSRNATVKTVQTHVDEMRKRNHVAKI